MKHDRRVRALVVALVVGVIAVVTATAACLGLRPVAKALGAWSSTMYSRGFGNPLAMHRPSTRLCSRA